MVQDQVNVRLNVLILFHEDSHLVHIDLLKLVRHTNNLILIFRFGFFPVQNSDAKIFALIDFVIKNFFEKQASDFSERFDLPILRFDKRDSEWKVSCFVTKHSSPVEVSEEFYHHIFGPSFLLSHQKDPLKSDYLSNFIFEPMTLLLSIFHSNFCHKKLSAFHFYEPDAHLTFVLFYAL